MHRKAALRSKPTVDKEFEDAYGPRKVELKPPSGEAYPHHEYFTESAGFDQSQLTARIPGSTPFIDDRPQRADEPAVPQKAKAR